MEKQLMEFDEIKDDCLNTDVKRVALHDSDDNILISYNNTNTPIETKLEQIEKKLSSRSLPDGIYKIKTKDFGHGTKPSTYYCKKGEIKNEIVNLADPMPLQNNSNAYESKYMDLLHENHKINLEKVRLELEIKRLEDKIDDLENDIEGLADQAPESNNTQDFLKDTLETITPLVDKYFSQQDEKIKMSKIELDQKLKNQELAERMRQMQEVDEDREDLDQEEQEINAAELYQQQMASINNQNGQHE